MIDVLHICVAMKPVEGSISSSASRWGVGGLNVDGCRVGSQKPKAINTPFNSWRRLENRNDIQKPKQTYDSNQGRFPANIILSMPEDEYILRDDVTPEQLKQLAEWMDENTEH